MLYQYDARKDVKHIVNAIHEATLNKDPFKSAYFCDILPEDLYDDMNAYFPPARVNERPESERRASRGGKTRIRGTSVPRLIF